MKLSDLKPNEENPRKITGEKLDKLKESIDSFPKMMELRPIIIDGNNIVIGGNMRLQALQELGFQEIPDNWVKKAEELTEEEKQEFIIKDNVGFGDWDWEVLGNDWSSEDLDNWGLEGWQNIDDIETSDEFSLPDGDKEPFQQITFTLADEQAEQIKNALETIKKTDEYKYCETMGNENSNGNALYLIISQWNQTQN